jgi:4-hydroxy-tetrahydrodipicolinate synthase
MGTIVPLVTPFADDETIDTSRMIHLVDYVLQQGADGVMMTALTGEGPLLSEHETLQVWDAVCKAVDRRAPIVPAIITTTTQQTCRLVRRAEALGAAAAMVAPILPELYAGRSHDDVYRFYADVADETSLPIVLFNYPSLTGVDFVPSLVERLAGIDKVRYIKESTGDSKRVHGIQRLVGDRISVICGTPNVALESLALGCRAWITGTMNVVPRSAQQMIRAVRCGNLELARRIYYKQILPVVDVMVRNNNPTGTIKAGVRARGVEVGVPRRPGSDVSKIDWEHITALVAEITSAEAATDE